MQKTLSEIADFYGISRQHVYSKIRRKKILPDGKKLIGKREYFTYSIKLIEKIMAPEKIGRPRKGEK